MSYRFYVKDENDSWVYSQTIEYVNEALALHACMGNSSAMISNMGEKFPSDFEPPEDPELEAFIVKY